MLDNVKMVVLAHHETFMLVLQYIVSLILGGYISFKYLFPMLGRGIVDLNSKLLGKLQKRIIKLKTDEDKWKQGVREKFEEDVAMILEQPEELQKTEIDKYFVGESQIAKVLSKKPDPLAEVKKQEDLLGIKRRKDDRCVIDGLYMTQDDIRNCSDSLEHI